MASCIRISMRNYAFVAACASQYVRSREKFVDSHASKVMIFRSWDNERYFDSSALRVRLKTIDTLNGYLTEELLA